MPSPFPGMNPYLEQERVWHDFHERFIPQCAAQLGAVVDSRYVVKIDEHVFIHELSAEERRVMGRADVAVAALMPASESGSPAAATSAAPARAVCLTGARYRASVLRRSADPRRLGVGYGS